MHEYVGMYRVTCEFERNTLKPIKDDTYIMCYNEGRIYRYDQEVLAYYRPNSSYGYACNLAKKFEEHGVEVLENHPSDEDILLYFWEKDIDKVAEIVGAVTKGCNIQPFSIRNLRKMAWFKKNKKYYIDLGLYKEINIEKQDLIDEIET